MEYTNSQMVALIREHIHSDRDRKILYSRLIDGMTIERMSDKYQLSPRQIKNIIYKNEQILFRKLP